MLEEPNNRVFINSSSLIRCQEDVEENIHLQTYTQRGEEEQMGKESEIKYTSRFLKLKVQSTLRNFEQ